MVFRILTQCSSPGRPLWSSGHSSWLQIQREEVEGLERGPLSLESTNEELLGRKSSGSGLESREYGRREIRHADHVAPSISKSWH
jgi:hypothetical protein